MVLMLDKLEESNRDKYLILKELQETLFQLVMYCIRGVSHHPTSHELVIRLQDLDLTIEQIESNLEYATDTLDCMCKEELEQSLKQNEDLYKSVKVKTIN